MALPFLRDTVAFEHDQEFNFRATVFDTACTVPSAGLGYALFDVVGAIGTIPTGRDSIEAVLGDLSKTRSVFGYVNSNCDYASGLIPLIYHYWGAGAPPGVSTVRRVITKYWGYVKTAGTVTMIFGGNGHVRGYVNQTTPLFLSGTVETIAYVREPQFEPDLLLAGELHFEQQGGYQIVQHTFAKGDLLELYYVQDNEDWGGFGVKVISQPVTALVTDWLVFQRALQDAPPLGASWVGVEANGNNLVGEEIPYVATAEIKNTVGEVEEMRLEVALALADEADGFRVESVDGNEMLVDNATVVGNIKKGRLVQFEGTYRRWDTYSDDFIEEPDLEPVAGSMRFTGHIIDIQPNEEGSAAMIICAGFANKLRETFDENLPDRLSYHLNGYIFREWNVEPVWPIPAYDTWPFEDSIADLGFRAGIDGWNFGRPVLISTDYARRQIYTISTQELVYGRRLFEARYLVDNMQKIILRRNAKYGNVGPLKKDYLPDDSPYIHNSNIAQTLLERVIELAEHYGYDFRFNAHGLGVLMSRNNPTAFTFFNSISDYDPCTGCQPPSGVIGPSGPPTNLQVTGFSSDTVDMSWTIGDSFAETYVEIATEDPLTQLPVNWQLGTIVAPGVSTAQLTGLTHNTTYYLRVRHFRNSQFSAYSNEVSFTTLEMLVPTNLSVTSEWLGGASYLANVGWTVATTGAMTEIYRSFTSFGGNNPNVSDLVFTTSADDNFFQDGFVLPGGSTNAYYVIRHIDASGNTSPFTAEFELTP